MFLISENPLPEQSQVKNRHCVLIMKSGQIIQYRRNYMHKFKEILKKTNHTRHLDFLSWSGSKRTKKISACGNDGLSNRDYRPPLKELFGVLLYQSRYIYKYLTVGSFSVSSLQKVFWFGGWGVLGVFSFSFGDCGNRNKLIYDTFNLLMAIKNELLFHFG